MIKSKILQIEKRLRKNKNLEDIKTFFKIERAIFFDDSEKIKSVEWYKYRFNQLKSGKMTKEQLDALEEELRAKDKIEYSLVITGSDGEFLVGL